MILSQNNIQRKKCIEGHVGAHIIICAIYQNSLLSENDKYSNMLGKYKFESIGETQMSQGYTAASI